MASSHENWRSSVFFAAGSLSNEPSPLAESAPFEFETDLSESFDYLSATTEALVEGPSTMTRSKSQDFPSGSPSHIRRSNTVRMTNSERDEVVSIHDKEAETILKKIRQYSRLKNVVSAVIIAQRWSRGGQLKDGEEETDKEAILPSVVSLEGVNQPDNHDELSPIEDSATSTTIEVEVFNGKRRIISGSINGLIDYLITPEENDLNYLHVFLSTYRYYIDTKLLLTKLTQMYIAIEVDANDLAVSEMESNVVPEISVARRNAIDWDGVKSGKKKNPLEFLSIVESGDTVRIIPDRAGAVPMSSALFKRSRILNVLKSWVARHPEDFIREKQQELTLQTFLKNHVENIPQLQPYARSMLDRMAANHIAEAKGSTRHPSTAAFVSHYSRIFASTNQNTTYSEHRLALAGGRVSDFKAEKLAEQLTIIDMEFFRRVYQDEFVQQKWAKPKTHAAASHLIQLINWFNHVSYWIATEICVEPKLSQRVALIKLFLEMAKYCLAFHNFWGVFEIVSGLMLTPVNRMKKTWKALPSKQKHLWNDLAKFASPEQNFSTYRETIKTSGYPLVPYVGVMLKDLTFAEDGSETILPRRNLINFFKMNMIGTILNEIRQYQQAEYHFAEDSRILGWLMSGMVNLPLDELIKRSKVLEPPTQS